MNDTEFAIYMYGSYARGEENSSSDVDLIAFGQNQWSSEHKIFLDALVLKNKPQWSGKSFDYVYFQGPHYIPKAPAQVAALAWLAHHPKKPVVETELVKKFCVPTWDQFYSAQVQIVHNWLVNTRNADRVALFRECMGTGHTKFVYNLFYSVCLLEKLSASPNEWNFSFESMNNSALAETKKVLRDTWNFKTPNNLEDIKKLNQICGQVSEYANKFKKLFEESNDLREMKL